MRRIAGRVCAGLVSLVGLAAAGHAAEPASPQPAQVSLAYVQLSSMMAPVVSRANGQQLGSAVVTAVLETEALDNVSAICAKAPRLLDALVQALYEQPIDIDAQRRLNFGSLEGDVRDRLNGALGNQLVNRVHLFSGSRSGEGGLLEKLPFTSVLGCRGGEKANGKAKNGR